MATSKADAGRKGGFIKWSKLSPEERSKIMRKVARARWAKKKNHENIKTAG